MSQAYPYNSNPIFNHSRYLTCIIQDGKIYTWNTEGTQQIGVTNGAYEIVQKSNEESLERLQEYYNALTQPTTCPNCKTIIPAIITPDLSPEDIIKQQAEQLRQSGQALADTQKALAQSLARLESLTAGGTPHEPVETDQRGVNLGDGPVKNKKSAPEGRRTDNGS